VKNLIFPSKKNLVIGLALVNVLKRNEFKAVLAHEFGHFAQRSMSVGIWVYMAQQIAAHMIAQRDMFDKFLRSLSRVDIRFAWIGWLLQLIVWSLRSITESVFDLVLRAQRALSREMEFHADLVAVSQTGSDALVHALFKLRSADDAWSKTQNFNYSELKQGRLTKDLFSVHTKLLNTMAEILNDPDYNSLPAGTENPNAEFRLFTPELAQPPQMWATHPYNHEREENAKQRYIPSPKDELSAWDMFSNAAERRAQGSSMVQQETLDHLSAAYSRRSYDKGYRGIYLNRSPVRHAESVNELFDDSISQSAIKDLYPVSLVDGMEKLRVLQQEYGLLESLNDGVYSAPGGIIRFRGDELVPHELPHVIEEIRHELNNHNLLLNDHDRLCRSAHSALASKAGNGWDAHHRGLASLLHFADHSHANLEDAHAVLNNVWRIVTVDRHVSGRERKRLLVAAQQLHRELHGTYEQAPGVALNKNLIKDWDANSWQEVLGELALPTPTKRNLHDWMQAIDFWTHVTLHKLSLLRSSALEALLECEQQLNDADVNGAALDSAPEAVSVPSGYTTLMPGRERELQKKLGLWDRFKTADGPGPSLARFAVSAGFVVGALVLTLVL